MDVAEFWFKRRAGDVAEDGQIHAEKYKIDTRFTTVECSYQGLAVRDILSSTMKRTEEVEGICYALGQQDEWFERFGTRKFYTITMIKKWFPKPPPPGSVPAIPRRALRASQAPRRTATQQQLQDRTDRLRSEATARRDAGEEEEEEHSDSKLLDEDNGDFRQIIKRR